MRIDMPSIRQGPARSRECARRSQSMAARWQPDRDSAGAWRAYGEVACGSIGVGLRPPALRADKNAQVNALASGHDGAGQLPEDERPNRDVSGAPAGPPVIKAVSRASGTPDTTKLGPDARKLWPSPPESVCRNACCHAARGERDKRT